ncbi:unnamed protein product [Sphagnum troendelagicum]|uniref:Transmembrane protein n=1 Tax=Sphagnum troendelagicum TaxID=128251 RepID=A0ABP0U8W9_9BRYO
MCGRISKEGGIESTFWQNNGPVFTLFVITWRLWFLVFSCVRIRCCCYFFFLLVAVVGFDAVLLRTSSAFCASGIRLRKSRPLLWNHFVVAGWLSVLPVFGGVGEVVGTGDFGLLLCWRFVDCCL